ncbi:hypothetical protein BC941DRAFT_452317 [Chlamydoabsidia padenii]|nr:hypothetical protein BC941DRAFT_452317 [Chlamydoabsidia padenii]
MLQIRESLSHSNSLIFTQPLLVSLPSTAPQPSISTTNHIVQQLQDKLERVLKELSATKTQLENTRYAKYQHDIQTKVYTESNQQYRIHIEGLTQILEIKQKTLDETKRSSVSMESQVKTLKDEAMRSRQQLEALRRREQVLARERDMAVTKKEQWERQRIVLHSSLDHLDRRFTREAGGLRQQLAMVQDRARDMTRYHKDLMAMVIKLMDSYMMDRSARFQQLVLAKDNLQHQYQQWTHLTQQDLTYLAAATMASGNTTDEFHVAVNKSRGEVNGLIMKIRAYTVVAE